MGSTYSHVVISASRREPLAIGLEVGRVDRGAGVVPVDDERCALHGVGQGLSGGALGIPGGPAAATVWCSAALLLSELLCPCL